MILLRRNFKIVVLSIFVLTLVLFFTQSAYAQNGSLYFSPSSGTISVGQSFSIVLRVNTGGTAINAAEGSVVFDPTKLSVSSISKSGSIFTIWASEPSFSNAEGSIEFAGGVPSPGYSGSNGLVLTINFKTKTSTSIGGSTDITLISGGILANDGYGTNILSSLGKANYIISPERIEPIPPPIEPGVAVPNLPKINITSPTHPDSLKWYSNNSPLFRWDLLPSVSKVALVLSRRANSPPIISYFPPISEMLFEDLEQGEWYLNGRFRTVSGLGPITSFKFNVDTQPPSAFSITRLDLDDPTNPRPELLFESSDATSGIDRYEIKVGEGEWIKIEPSLAGRAYAIPLQRYGNYAVEIKALDRASNSTSAKLDIKIEPIKAPVIKEITKEAYKGGVISVKGTAEPNRKIIIEFARNGRDLINLVPKAYAQEIDENYYTYETLADENGNWSVEIADLPVGTYKVGARAQDERQAVSELSNRMATKIKDGILDLIFRLFDKLINILSGYWLFIVFVIALVGLMLALIESFRIKAKKCFRPMSDWLVIRRTKKRQIQIEHIIKDMEKELKFIRSMGKLRKLGPEESYLKSNGETSITPEADSNNGNMLLTQQAILSQTATIQSLSFYVTTAVGNLRLGVYDATGPSGGPGQKKAETNSFTPVLGWNTANVISPVSLPAGTYWLAYLPSDNALAFRADRTRGTYKYYAYTFGVMPQTYGTPTGGGTSTWSLYTTLNTGTTVKE